MTSVMMGSAVIASQYVNRGIEHFRQNQFDHAIANFDAALQINPDDPYARWNRATALLSIGDYARGFPEHDVAWRLFHWRGFGPVKDHIDRIKHLPMWRGEHQARLLLYHELGHGDAIMAFRFLPEVRQRADVTLVIDPALARLARTFNIEVLTELPDDLSGFDFRLPFFGVMSTLHQTAETIPSAPYIGMRRAVPITGWMRHEIKTVAGEKIGIAWSGRTQTMFSLQRFLQLADIDGFRLFALQPGPTIDGVQPLRPGCDFADVADLIAEMDHIVTVDTASAHLAGAMGHPSQHLVLPFLSDWRWHRTDVWYPALKTYRQRDASDWNAPFGKLNEALHVGRV